MTKPVWTDSGSLLLPIDPALWLPSATALQLDGIEFTPKTELHVTLIGNTLGRELRAAVADPVQTLRAVVGGARWDFQREGRALLLRKAFDDGGRCRVAHSIIERVQLPAMVPLYAAIGRLLGRQPALPPAHVSLYVGGRAKGIAVSSRARLRAFSVRAVAAEELSR